MTDLSMPLGFDFLVKGILLESRVNSKNQEIGFQMDLPKV